MISVILLMAGSGSRMNIDKNKILLPLGDKCIFEIPLDLFLSYNFEVICVVNKNDLDYVKPLIKNKAKIVIGGKTRMESVYNGLKEASGDYVLIHDSARPLVSKDVIDKIIEIKNNDNCILCYRNCKDTIKNIEDGIKTLDRSKLISAVTPQCGPKELLLNAFEKAFKDNKEFTDDISLIENYYKDVKIDLVLANEESFKITTPIDYELLKLVWSKK